jgi:hypothetical protein
MRRGLKVQREKNKRFPYPIHPHENPQSLENPLFQSKEGSAIYDWFSELLPERVLLCQDTTSGI